MHRHLALRRYPPPQDPPRMPRQSLTQLSPGRIQRQPVDVDAVALAGWPLRSRLSSDNQGVKGCHSRTDAGRSPDTHVPSGWRPPPRGTASRRRQTVASWPLPLPLPYRPSRPLPPPSASAPPRLISYRARHTIRETTPGTCSERIRRSIKAESQTLKFCVCSGSSCAGVATGLTS
jgi:hypothetical protein